MDSSLAILLANAGTAGIFCVLFILGLIYPRSIVTDLRKDLETERAAHEQTRAALAIASARADAGVRAAELVASAVEGARHVPQAPP